MARFTVSGKCWNTMSLFLFKSRVSEKNSPPSAPFGTICWAIYAWNPGYHGTVERGHDVRMGLESGASWFQTNLITNLGLMVMSIQHYTTIYLMEVINFQSWGALEHHLASLIWYTPLVDGCWLGLCLTTIITRWCPQVSVSFGCWYMFTPLFTPLTGFN